MNKKWIVIAVIVILLVALLAWLFIESTKPLPGEKLLQDGRSHIPEGSKTDYKFNPPTSGDHYPSWITKGFYNEPRPDGNVVHSQEHGYVIIWYDCGRKTAMSSPDLIGGSINKIVKWIPAFAGMTVYAQGVAMTAGSDGSASAKLQEMPKAFSDGSCNNLEKQLKDVYQKFGPHKLIVMPHPGMDSPVILTAWGRMEKLTSVDSGKIKEFIDAFRDNGPEATVEP